MIKAKITSGTNQFHYETAFKFNVLKSLHFVLYFDKICSLNIALKITHMHLYMDDNVPVQIILTYYKTNGLNILLLFSKWKFSLVVKMKL